MKNKKMIFAKQNILKRKRQSAKAKQSAKK